jgi:hypothetical protein
MIDLLVSNSSWYSLESTCIPGIERAFAELGIETRRFDLDHEMADYLRERGEKALCLTDPIKRERPLSDIFQIPTIQWEIGVTLSPVIHLLKSPYTQLVYSDYSVKHGRIKNFCPAVDPKWQGEKEKFYHTVCFEPLTCLDAKKESLKRLFPNITLEHIERYQDSKWLNASLHPAISHNDSLHAMEDLRKAKRLLPLVESFQSPLSLFGEHVGKNWLVRLENASKVSLHSLLPFSERIEVLKSSEFLLVDTPQEYIGHPFWMLVAPLCGALPLVPHNPMLEKTFGTQAFCYHSEEPESLQERLHFFQENKDQKKALVEEMKKVILKEFTWKNQLQKLEKLYASF